jgi:hypothetical protein
MEQQMQGLRIILGPDGFYPQALHWQGRTLRVLYIERVQTAGLERRYRVRTLEGPFELCLHIGTGVWQIHRSPGWLDRARAHLAALPRYPLPAMRRRAHPAMKVVPLCLPLTSEGGDHAKRLALVRQ